MVEVRTAYEQELNNANSLLLRNPESAEQVLASCTSIVADVVEGLRDSAPTTRGEDISREIAVTRARHGVHPTESLRAAEILFEVVLRWVDQRLGPEREDAREALVELSLLLSKSIALRIREASSWYASFLLQEIHRVQSDERARLARELHDRVSYGVTVGHRNLESLQRRGRNLDPETVRRCVSMVQLALEEAIEAIRKLIGDLRVSESVPSLEKALHSFLFEAEPVSAVTSVVVNGDESWVDHQVRDEVFLIVREALRNALDHSGAGRVLVQIDIAPHELRATVADDGTGFAATGASDGAGLSIMAERAALLGGNTLVSSRIGKGTRVELTVPLLRDGNAGTY
ncbi:sensor histidine kinase [Nonomuraea turcica]|uniref:sensor histidine kinase n=1 Tax=Nonomuraea sp. G32 TaxID=3067274 RepID=UPI00273BA975|nr:ATP-binding protein [Nonomuraea sp. G32]MDP4503532.1 histidine kinase [Nonomuraea sp. G32]